MVSLNNGHIFPEENDILRRRSRPEKEDSTFSLRSPLNRTPKQLEQPSPQNHNTRSDHRDKFRQRQTDERKTTLAHFAPDLVKKLGRTTPDSSDKSASHLSGPRKSTERHRRGWSEPKERLFTQRQNGHQHQKTQLRSGQKDRQKGAKLCHKETKSCGPKTSSQLLLPEDVTDLNDSKDSRVRKCLWADEVDEAFEDADNGSSGDSAQLDELEESPFKPLTEQQLARRQKDIDYGKSTSGYTNYVQQVKKEERNKKCPQTPDKLANHSRRKWDYLVHKWRRDLHNFDDPSEENSDTSKENTPHKERQQTRAGDRTPSPKPLSLPASIASTPSDQGYATTPDSKANTSFEQNSSQPELPDKDADFPPLTTTADVTVPGKAVWVKTSETGSNETGDSMMESEDLKNFAEKLVITSNGTAECEVEMQE